MVTKATKKTRPLTIEDLRTTLKKKGTRATASMNLLVKYSSAAVGIFDFVEDMNFYEYQMTGKDIAAKKIVLSRLSDLKEKKGKLLEGKELRQADILYMKEFIEWAKSSKIKKLEKDMRRRIKNQSEAYEEILQNEKKYKYPKLKAKSDD